MTDPFFVNQLLRERFIDAQEASHCLNLPLYWLTHVKERRARGIPHYRVGKLLRFKLQELEAWMASQQVGTANVPEGRDAGLQ
ncbi:helix-turn-helix domain-containing protein [Castellaniella hirudinis]|uniref:helix-turn-helix domain-containing protein n=1 Tax=Castellaniella hirudinis TaxID=1144617 RepID=UPI0039C2FE0F